MINIFELLALQIPENFFLLFEIGMMIIIAGIVGFVLKLLKQPLIPSYIIAGIILGPLGIGLIRSNETLLVLSEIGVAFLLFYAGIEMNLKKLKEVGKSVIFTGIFQIAILFGLAFFISLWLGINNKIPIYIGLVVAFSSTMVVLKLLSDKREINSLHGRIIIGILLVQDVAAIIALTILTTDLSMASMGLALLKALGFAIVAFILSKAVNPIFRISAKSTELLLLTAITLLFLFAIGSYAAGLSLIIGSFFAGMALANSDYRTEIQGKIMPLRDFFAVLFFVALGMQLTLISRKFIIPLIILILLVMVIKPLVIMILVRLSGYSKRTSYLTGNALAQTSEFSLIIATIGLTLGYIDSGLFSALVVLTIISMASTNYFINYNQKFFNLFGWPLNVFKRLHSNKEVQEYSNSASKKIILLGCHRMGSLFLRYLSKKREEVLIVDYDPSIIKSLAEKKISCIYGDFTNSEVLEKINFKAADLVVSTIPDIEGNLLILKKIKDSNSKVIFIATAERISNAEELYRQGADYVLLPKVISGEIGFNLARKLMKNKQNIKKMKKDQKDYLKNIHHLLSE